MGHSQWGHGACCQARQDRRIGSMLRPKATWEGDRAAAGGSASAAAAVAAGRPDSPRGAPAPSRLQVGFKVGQECPTCARGAIATRDYKKDDIILAVRAGGWVGGGLWLWRAGGWVGVGLAGCSRLLPPSSEGGTIAGPSQHPACFAGALLASASADARTCAHECPTGALQRHHHP